MDGLSCVLSDLIALLETKAHDDALVLENLVGLEIRQSAQEAVAARHRKRRLEKEGLLFKYRGQLAVAQVRSRLPIRLRLQESKNSSDSNSKNDRYLTQFHCDYSAGKIF